MITVHDALLEVRALAEKETCVMNGQTVVVINKQQFIHWLDELVRMMEKEKVEIGEGG